MFSEKNDEFYMTEAIREARMAFAKEEVPIGCIIVYENQIIAKAHNLRESLKDPTAHAEMIAITQAAAFLNNWRLDNTKMYVTLEPCPMCAGAIINARISEVIYGATDPKGGSCVSNNATLKYENWNHKVQLTTGVMEQQCAEILIDFFQMLRKKKKNNPDN